MFPHRTTLDCPSIIFVWRPYPTEHTHSSKQAVPCHLLVSEVHIVCTGGRQCGVTAECTVSHYYEHAVIRSRRKTRPNPYASSSSRSLLGGTLSVAGVHDANSHRYAYDSITVTGEVLCGHLVHPEDRVFRFDQLPPFHSDLKTRKPQHHGSTDLYITK